MAKSPVFSAKRKSELLQSRSDQRSHFGRGLLDLVEKVLPRIFHRQEQKVAIASFDPFRRKPPKLAAEGGDVPVVQFGRETSGTSSVSLPDPSFLFPDYDPSTILAAPVDPLPWVRVLWWWTQGRCG